MLKTQARVPEEPHFTATTLAPSQAQKRLAFAVVLSLSLVFALIAEGPLKGVRLARVDAFVPAYATALFVCESFTALLLYAQFSIVRSRATLVIASGYLFAGLVVIPWVLAFAGLFGPTALVGGMQTTSYLYFFRHMGFPLFVIGYAFLKDEDAHKRFWQGTLRAEIALSIGLTATIVVAGTFFFISGEALLPPLILDATRFSPLQTHVMAPIAALVSFTAMVILWTRRRTVLDLWLTVIMFLFLIEIPFNYYPIPERFSLNWYAVRVLGVLSSSIVLMVLLHEITTLYASLLRAVLAQHREREARLITGDAVAASIAHEVRQPLTAMVTTADAGLRFLDRAIPNLDKAKEAFRLIAADGHRAGAVVGNIRANFKSDVRDTTSFDLNQLIQDTLALGHDELEKHGIQVRADPNERLPEVAGNRVQLQQVLLNLIVNAIDAMATKEEPKILTVKSEVYQGDHVMVSVADTGTGISSQHSDRLFNPLFTTKSDGMGMGLSICRAIIEAHEGRLWFAPNTPQGAVFQFTLQAHSSTSAAE